MAACKKVYWILNGTGVVNITPVFLRVRDN